MPFLTLLKKTTEKRSEPSLFKDGKVCLSLLGTWAGPGWVAGKSTLLQASERGYGEIGGAIKPQGDAVVILGSHLHSVNDPLRGAVFERTGVGH
jgi:hypothetical protein